MPDLIRTAKNILKPVVGPPRHLYQLARARRIDRRYRQQYEEARLGYSVEPARPPIFAAPDRVGVWELTAPGSGVTLPDGYPGLVNRLAREVAARFELTEHCLFMPALPREGLPPRTADVPQVRRGEIISLQLREPLGVPGLEDLARMVLPHVERLVYQSHVLVDKVYVYRNVVSRQRELVSWLWHYDNHPREILKLMLYLTDVDEGSGPFEYVRSKATGEAYTFDPRPLVGTSRVPPASVESLLANGYERRKATGARGTLLLFDDNVLHKANLATSRPRDVIVFQIRPATSRAGQYVDARFTGTFEHEDFPLDPFEDRPRLKRRKFSG